jgi:hypothetical protein
MKIYLSCDELSGGGEMSRYDVVIAYRICPKLGRGAFKLSGWDKLKLSEVCLRSFLDSLSNVDFKIYAILDGCPPQYDALFRDLIPSDNLEILHFPGIGNHATFIEQIKILLNQNESEIVYFAEDDYFYDKGFDEMIELIRNRRNVDFVTPYDHPDYYQDKTDPRKPAFLVKLHDYKSKIIFEKRHWRTVSSTCCTFLTTKTTLKKTAQYFRLYPKLGDYGMWLTLTKMGLRATLVRKPLLTAKIYAYALKRMLIGRPYKLWAPIPSIATHMVELYLAPGIDWASLIKQYDR